MKKGYIGLLNLDEWWSINLTEDDRIWLVRNFDGNIKYDTDISAEKRTEIKNKDGRQLLLQTGYLPSNQNKNFLLFNLLECALGINYTFTKNINYNLALKIIYTQEHINVEDAYSVYLSFGALAKWYYEKKDKPIFLYKAIEFYEKQIFISEYAQRKYIEDNRRVEQLLKRDVELVMPVNESFNNLAIIYEEEKEYEKALVICKKAMLEGWSREKNSEDWETIIKRLNYQVES